MKAQTEEILLNQSNPLFSPTILRLATVFGCSYRPRFDLVVNTFAKDAYFSNLITVHGGSQWRPHVHVRDIGNAVIKILGSPIQSIARKIYNVGSANNNHTVKEIADMAVDVFSDCRLVVKETASDQRDYRVDFSKIERELDFSARISVRAGFNELLGFFQSSPRLNIQDPRFSNIKFLETLKRDSAPHTLVDHTLAGVRGE